MSKIIELFHRESVNGREYCHREYDRKRRALMPWRVLIFLVVLAVSCAAAAGCAATTSTSSTLDAKSIEEAAPATKQTVPVMEQTTSAAEEAASVTRQSIPVTGQAIPISKQTSPTAKEGVATAEQAVPAAKQVALAAEQVATVAKQAVSGVEQTSPASGQVTSGSTLVKSGYVDVGGLKMYYEIHGVVHKENKPLVLLHGAFGNIPSWGSTLTALAQSREVISFELEGHGRTADLDRPLSFDQMTDDVAAAVRKLGFDKVDVMGYSLGGAITLRMGMKYPELVQKLVVVSGLYSNDGYYPAIPANWPTVQSLVGTQEEKDYAQLAPDPSHWPMFVDKLDQALTGFKGWPESEVKAIKAPTLIICGDNDAVRPEYEMQLFRMLGGDKALGGFNPLVSQMAVLPNTTHFSIYLRHDLLIPIIDPFLDAFVSK